MKKRIISALLLATSITFFWGCGSDSSNNAPSCLGVSCIESAAAANFTVTDTCHWLPGDIDYLIYNDGRVTDANGNEIGSFDAATGTITKTDGTVIENVNLAELTELTPEKVQEIKDAVEEAEKGASEENQGNSSNSGNGTEQGQGNATVGSSGSGTSTPAEESSSSVFQKVQGGVADPTGYPVASYKNLLAGGAAGKGWNSRYWDACKPHCSWPGNVDTTSEAAYQSIYTTAKNCNIHDVEIPTYTLKYDVQQFWMGYTGIASGCKPDERGGGETGAFTCTDMVPVAINDTLAYAFVAGPSDQGCGKCYHLQYDGHFANEMDTNKPKETHLALAGKHVIAMASNIGHDVDANSTQFDLMVPGGGVGTFDALSLQVGADMRTSVANSGGFLTSCQEKLGYDAHLEDYQSCVKEYCSLYFANLPNLLQGCNWFADWFMAADNPTFYWEEVDCPQYLIDKYMTTINTTIHNRIRWQDDWSSYNGGELETQECLTENYPQGCGP